MRWDLSSQELELQNGKAAIDRTLRISEKNYAESLGKFVPSAMYS